jgi:SAM-dependent methyltransferase
MTDTASPSQRAREARHILDFGRSGDSPYLVHLQSPFSIANYQRIADSVARLARPHAGGGTGGTARVLDWGAGFGQVSYLMAERGLNVTSYDVGEPGTYPLPIDTRRHIVRGEHPSALPFDDGTFDVVLSCGVLEHVPAEETSLDEIRRVLRPGGLFIIFNLPQRGGYTEYIVRLFKLGYTHERRYSARGTRAMLARHGIRVRSLRRSNILPHNFRGLPAPARLALSSHAGALLRADLALSAIPGLNRVCGILEVVAVRVS